MGPCTAASGEGRGGSRRVAGSWPARADRSDQSRRSTSTPRARTVATGFRPAWSRPPTGRWRAVAGADPPVAGYRRPARARAASRRRVHRQHRRGCRR